MALPAGAGTAGGGQGLALLVMVLVLVLAPVLVLGRAARDGHGEGWQIVFLAPSNTAP